jgi:hypothetical protein
MPHLRLRRGLCVYPAAIGSRRLGLDIRRYYSFFDGRPSSDRRIACGDRRAWSVQVVEFSLDVKTKEEVGFIKESDCTSDMRRSL